MSNRAKNQSTSKTRVLLKSLGYLAAILLVPLLAGGANMFGKLASYRQIGNPPAYAGPLPATPQHNPERKIAVVLSSAYGVEMTDFLSPYEILARSGAFDVYAVAPERKLLPIVNSNMHGTTLDFIPHFSFAEYESAIGRAPDLIAIPWVPGHTAERNAALLDWIRTHTGPHTTLLTICAGTQILAETGLLDEHTATTNVAWYAKLERAYPRVNWVRNVRYMDDGKVITSTNLASGIDATLRAVSRLAGRDVAEKVARELGYRHAAYLDDPRFQPSVSAVIPLTLNAAFTWGEQDLGVLLYDGVSEMALAGLIDQYTSTAVVRTHVVAPERRVVRSRNGLTFVPRYDIRTVPQLDRIVLPGGDTTESMQRTLAAWTQQRPQLPVEQIHRNVGAGESGYDATLRDMARTLSGTVAQSTGSVQFYPTEGLQFTDARSSIAPVAAPLALSLLGIGSVFATGRVRAMRRAPQGVPVPQAA